MSEHPPATIPGTEVRRIRSRLVPEEVELSIALPPGYTRSDERYPVLYALDANLTIGMPIDIARGLFMERLVPPLLVVCVGYPLGFTRYRQLRMRDFTPTSSPGYATRWPGDGTSQPLPPDVQSGGADQFFGLLRDEVIPFVEANYRVNADRTLFGHSASGLFASFVLLTRPDSFARYVIGSPALFWDGGVIFGYEEKRAAAHTDLRANVFLGVGVLEDTPEEIASGVGMVGNVRRLATALGERRYPGLRLDVEVFENETHASVMAPIISRGLRSVFA